MASATGATQDGRGRSVLRRPLVGGAGAHAGRLAIAVEVVMVVAWFVVRTVAGVDGRAYLLWVIAAGALALVAPRSGLVVLRRDLGLLRARQPCPDARPARARSCCRWLSASSSRSRPTGSAGGRAWRSGSALLLVARDGAGRRAHVPRLRARTSSGTPPSRGSATCWRRSSSSSRPPGRPATADPAGARRRGRRRRSWPRSSASSNTPRPGRSRTGRSPGSGSGRTSGRGSAGTIPSPNALSTQLIVPTMVLLAAVLLARDRPAARRSRWSGWCRWSSRST